jgi:hypothetical protein
LRKHTGCLLYLRAANINIRVYNIVTECIYIGAVCGEDRKSSAVQARRDMLWLAASECFLPFIGSLLKFKAGSTENLQLLYTLTRCTKPLKLSKSYFIARFPVH